MILESNITQILAQWRAKPRQLEAALVRGFKKGLREFEGKRVIQAQLSGRKNSDYGLNVGTGNARNASDVKTFREGMDTVGFITFGSRAWYLKLHQHYQFDGYATAKNGTSFCIPIHPDAKRRWPRDFGSQLQFIKRPGRPPLLVRITDPGKGKSRARFDIMYVLKKQIFIPKRLYLYEEFETYGRSMISNSIESELRLAVNERAGWET